MANISVRGAPPPWLCSNIRVFDKTGTMVADDSEFRYRADNLDVQPPLSDMKTALGLDGANGGSEKGGALWLESESEAAGLPPGTRNGYACDYPDADFNSGDLEPFHCTCPGSNPSSNDCQAIIG